MVRRSRRVGPAEDSAEGEGGTEQLVREEEDGSEGSGEEWPDDDSVGNEAAPQPPPPYGSSTAVAIPADPVASTKKTDDAERDRRIDRSFTEYSIINVGQLVLQLVVFGLICRDFGKAQQIYTTTLLGVFAAAVTLCGLLFHKNKREEFDKTQKDDEEFRAMLGIGDLALNVTTLLLLVGLNESIDFVWAVPWFMPLVYIPGALAFLMYPGDEYHKARYLLGALELLIFLCNVLVLFTMEERQFRRNSALLLAFNFAESAVDFVLIAKFVPL